MRTVFDPWDTRTRFAAAAFTVAFTLDSCNAQYNEKWYDRNRHEKIMHMEVAYPHCLSETNMQDLVYIGSTDPHTEVKELALTIARKNVECLDKLLNNYSRAGG